MAPANITSLSHELITRIATHLTTSRHHGLLSFVLTCRLISEPALDALWYKLCDITPLMLTLPPDLVAVSSPPDSLIRRHFVILRDPTTQDFHRFSSYARRIQVLDHRLPRGGYAMTQEIWDFIQVHAPKPLLPSLRILEHVERPFEGAPNRKRLLMVRTYPSSLSLEGVPDPCDLCAEPFFGQNLKHANIMQAAGEDSQIMLRALSFRSPHIESLGLTSFWGNIGEHELGVFSNLVRISARNLESASAAAFWGLGTLPRLKEMTIHLNEGLMPLWDWDEHPHGRDAGLFPSLERLDVLADDVDWFISFIRTVTSPSLASITFKQSDGWMGPDICAAMCQEIVSLPSRDRLVFLSLSTSEFCRCNDPTSSAQIIAPLLTLRGLQHLRLGFQSFFDDDMLDTMSLAWPDMRTLHLRWTKPSACERPRLCQCENPRVVHRKTPQASLVGLIPLVLRCTYLTELGVPVDTRLKLDRTVRIIRHPPPELRSSRSLVHTFGAEGSMLGRDEPAFEITPTFLSLLFPQLRMLRVGLPGKLWAAVGKRCLALSRVRGEERRWADRGRFAASSKEIDDGE
ncbi:hypothetical protein FKP32DRAFT_91005 [Trametes sanguinea]|nr:hypothetical protein FKP32DRAFT_91005 [Trametes sanguinea]